MSHIVAARNPKWANSEHNMIDIEVDFEGYPEEYLPYTCSPTDVVEHSRTLYAQAVNGDYGTIAEFEDWLKWNPVDKTSVEVSNESLVQILLEKGVLTDAEVDTILVEKTETVGFARTTADGTDRIWNGIY